MCLWLLAYNPCPTWRPRRPKYPASGFLLPEELQNSNRRNRSRSFWLQALRGALRSHDETAKDPGFNETFAAQMIEPIGTMPAEFGKFLRTEHDKWGKVIKDAKLNLQP